MESKELGKPGPQHYPAEDQDCNGNNSSTISLGTVVERRPFALTSTHLTHHSETPQKMGIEHWEKLFKKLQRSSLRSASVSCQHYETKLEQLKMRFKTSTRSDIDH